MGKYKKTLIGLFGIGVSIGSIYYLANKIDFSKAFEAVGQIEWWWPVVMVAVYLSSFILRTFRWKLMLSNYPDISFKKFFNSLIIGFFGNNVLPARGGEVVRMLYFSRETKVNGVVSMTSVLTEKILDGLALVMLLVVSIWLSGDLLSANDWLQPLTYTVTAIFVGGILGLIVLRLVGKPLIAWAEAKGGILEKLAGIASKVLDATEFLQPNFQSIMVILLSVGVWAIEGVVFSMGIMAFDIAVNPWIAGFFTLTIVNFGLLVPSSPGYVGVFQYLTTMALALYLVPEEQALALSFVVHACQFIPITLWGFIILMRSSISLFAKPESEPQDASLSLENS